MNQWEFGPTAQQEKCRVNLGMGQRRSGQTNTLSLFGEDRVVVAVHTVAFSGP